MKRRTPLLVAAVCAASLVPPFAAAQDAMPAAPAAEAEVASTWNLEWFGYLRARYATIMSDEAQTDFVGVNDGFVLGNARLGLEATQDDVTVMLSIDGAVDRRDAGNTAEGEIKTELKDAYIDWAFSKHVGLRVGQFKPPFDAEELQSTRDMLFIHRSVPSRGVTGVEGYNVDGLSVDRQVGLMLRTEAIYFGASDMGVRAYLTAANGSGANRPLNDNESLAGFGRFEFLYGKDDQPLRATLGAGAFVNEVTTGRAPDRFSEDRMGLAVDLDVEAWGALLNAQLIERKTSVADVDGEPEITARGWHASLGYRGPWGLIPGYRIASYDPTADFEAVDPALEAQLDVDDVLHHTIALSWLVPGRPLKLQLEYTLATENDDRDIDNDRVEALIQAAF